jgi:PKD repeat protein
VVYVGNDRGTSVFALDTATGRQVWNYPMGGIVYGGPAVADGSVYVGSSSILFALGIPPPAAMFNPDPATGMAPLTVTFTDISTNLPTSWNWSFGDGTFSEAQHPVHTYVSGGYYTVILIASHNGEGSTSPGFVIMVAPRPPRRPWRA